MASDDAVNDKAQSNAAVLFFMAITFLARNR
jgi:hypothetical protein